MRYGPRWRWAFTVVVAVVVASSLACNAIPGKKVAAEGTKEAGGAAAFPAGVGKMYEELSKVIRARNLPAFMPIFHRDFIFEAADGSATVSVEGQSFEVEPARTKPQAPAAAPSSVAPAAPSAPKAAPAPAGAGTIAAPIPGVVTNLCLAAGDSVEAGQVVLKLEAMKMENDISTPVAGSVKEIKVSEGAEVSDGQVLLVVG